MNRLLSHQERQAVLDAVRYLGDLEMGENAIRCDLVVRGWTPATVQQALAEVVGFGLTERRECGLRLTRLGSAFLERNPKPGNLAHSAGLLRRAAWIEHIDRLLGHGIRCSSPPPPDRLRPNVDRG